MYIYCILSCNVKKHKTIAKFSKTSRNKCCSKLIVFMVFSVMSEFYCYHFLILLKLNQIPEKQYMYLGQ
jgi:hypothetical protein